MKLELSQPQLGYRTPVKKAQKCGRNNWPHFRVIFENAVVQVCPLVYDSLGREFVPKRRSRAALVSPLFRIFSSETHSVTVDTISRAAVRELLMALTLGVTFLTSNFLITLILIQLRIK